MSLFNPFTGKPLWYSGKTGQSYSNKFGSKGFFSFNGKMVKFDLNNVSDFRNVYMICPPLKAIINKRARMFVNGSVEILNRNTDSSKKGSAAKFLRDKLRKPNILQSWKQFFAQFHTYIDLFGYCPVIKIAPVGMPDEISALWCLPPWLFDVEFTGKWMNQTETKGIYKKFWFTGVDGNKKELPFEDVCLVLDNEISTKSDMRLVLPDSRIVSQEYPISNIIATYMSRNTLITKKGAIGILSNIGKDSAGPIKLDPEEKEAVQDDFKRYGLTGQDYQVIITDASLQWQSMSFPTKDLMLFEEIEDDILRLCDGCGMYPDLMGSIKKSTFANLNEAKKAQYQDFIIPDAESRLEQLSSFLLPAELNSYLWIDYMHLEVFQTSIKDKADALSAQASALQKLWDLNLVTRNMMLMELGRDQVQDEMFDKYKIDIDATTQQQGDQPGGPNASGSL